MALCKCSFDGEVKKGTSRGIFLSARCSSQRDAVLGIRVSRRRKKRYEVEGKRDDEKMR